MNIAKVGRRGKVKLLELSDKEKDAFEKEAEESEVYFKSKEYIKKRNDARGSIGEQLEYIVENGLQAFINRDEQIRREHPKPKD